MGVEKTLLPKEYQQVEYIENAEKQNAYIDSGVTITDDLRFVVDFQVTGTIKAGRYLMGVYNEANKHFYLYISANQMFQFDYACGWGNTNVSVDSNRHTFEFFYEDGKVFVTEQGTAIFQKVATPSDAAKIHFAGVVQAASKSCRTYSAKMIKGGELIHDFIPCYRKSDQKPGMYDLISGEFYTNAGSGEFVVGEDV